MYNIIISIFCIGIIFFIFMTRCKVSKIQLKMKDASLILIFFALLAYINGHEYLFIFILLAFIPLAFQAEALLQTLLAAHIRFILWVYINFKPNIFHAVTIVFLLAAG